MNKICFSLFLIMIFLSACNLPIETIPSGDIVATQVAKILTETVENSNIEFLTQTQPFFTEVSEVYTPTSDAPESVETTSSQPTITNTATMDFTATTVATSVPSPTLDQSDPAVSFGSPDWVDDFSSSGSKWDYEDEWSTFKVEDDFLKIRSNTTPYWNSWNLSTPRIQNFYLEMTFNMPLCSGGDRIGLVFRAPDINQFYFMGITCDGKWGFDKYTDQETPLQNILPYTASSQLKPADQNNRVGIFAEDETFRFYINGVKVGETNDNTYTETGLIGFISRYIGTKGFTTHVDKLQYWLLP